MDEEQIALRLCCTQSTNTAMSFGWKVWISGWCWGVIQLMLIYAALRERLRQRCIKSLGISLGRL